MSLRKLTKARVVLIAAIGSLLSLLEDKFSLQLDFCRRTPYQDGKLARLRLPVAFFDVKEGKRSPVKASGHALRFTGAQIHFRESFQFLHRTWHTGVRVANIHLGDLRARARTDVLHVEGNGDCVEVGGKWSDF